MTATRRRACVAPFLCLLLCGGCLADAQDATTSDQLAGSLEASTPLSFELVPRCQAKCPQGKCAEVCLPDEPTGLSCGEMMSCLSGCDDMVCPQSCMESASPGGRAELQAMSDCFEAAGHDDGVGCGASVAECLTEDVGVHGCAVTLSCSEQCFEGDDEGYECLADCLDDATEDARGQFAELWICAVQGWPWGGDGLGGAYEPGCAVQLAVCGDE